MLLPAPVADVLDPVDAPLTPSSSVELPGTVLPVLAPVTQSAARGDRACNRPRRGARDAGVPGARGASLVILG